MDTIKAKIGTNERRMIYRLMDTGIMPQTEFISLGETSVIKMKTYPTTLANALDNDVVSAHQVRDVVNSRIAQLHANGVLHGNLHANNIVFNPETMDVRIIDFEFSVMIKDIMPSDIVFFRHFWDNDAIQNVDDLIEYEMQMWT